MVVAGLLLAALVGGSSGSSTRAATPAVTPVQAELLADLQARHLKVGEVIYARVFSAWEGPGCSLGKGAIVQAKVVAAVPHSKMSRESQVALSFDGAQCQPGKIGAFPLILAAIAMPEEDDSAELLDMPMPTGAGTSSANAPSNGMRSTSSYDADLWWVMTKGFSRFPDVHAGGVYGIHGLRLSVATGPENSTVLVSKDRDVAIYKHTELLLIPEAAIAAKGAEAPSRGSEAPSVSVAVIPVEPPREPLLEEETCAPPDCSVALENGEEEAEGRPAENISIDALGYTQRAGRLMDRLGDDETLSYLSPNELLLTFNLHGLVPRMGDTDRGTVRMIRAALVDTDAHRVRRIVDWRMRDDRQYLWPLGGGRVLVHVGNELRIYGAGLTVEASMVLGGPLAFLRTDPAGATIVAGIIEERHSPELHAKLRETLGREPDENVRVLVLNQRFETTATGMSTTEFLPPVLLNEGEVKLYRQTEKRYHLVIESWVRGRRSLALFTSSCRPAISTASPDLIFLTTCNSLSRGREYRILRADGKAILQGASPPLEFGYSMLGNEQSGDVVLKAVASDRPLEVGDLFHLSDLNSESLRVYNAVNGKHVFSVRLSEPIASTGGYAMAPDGEDLAVLTRNEITIYTLPRERAGR
ncbi:MAG TPA: hypothetical protein VHX37_06085 [Acidobacteriaceae bacterium]|jgi:hypothetical protein|nr:hypothetical protein [Acidobacteriaceae bacterium]